MDGHFWSLTAERSLLRESLVEVVPVPENDADVPPVYRTRLIALGEDTMRIERPEGPGVAHRTRPGASLRVVFADGAERWQVTATVSGTIRRPLNETSHIYVVNLVDVRLPCSAQRRGHFRVSTRGVGVIAIELSPEEPLVAPEQGPSVEVRGFGGTLVNLSGGGMGFVTRATIGEQVRYCLQYNARVVFPDEPAPTLVPIRVCHHHKQGDGATYVGVSFDIADPGEDRRFTERMCKMATKFQRELLRKRYACRHPGLEDDEDFFAT